MAEFFVLVKNFIRFLRESKDSKFLKSSKGRLLFTFVSIILDLILALIKNPSLLQNLFNGEKDDLVSHCKSPYRSKYNLLEKPIFEEDLKGRKHCGIIKFSILPIQTSGNFNRR